MRKMILLAVCCLSLAGAGGCGGPTTRPAGPASEEDQKKDLDEQRKVEAEERGPQAKPGQGKKPR